MPAKVRCRSRIFSRRPTQRPVRCNPPHHRIRYNRYVRTEGDALKLYKMKRKYADRRGWRRIIRSRTSSKLFMWPSFHGEAVLLTFDEIRAPLSVVYDGNRTKTVDRQFSWLQLFSERHPHFVLTAMFDAEKRLVQCYFDIVGGKGRDPDGVLWFDDLYLDIILFPNQKLYLVDEDELDDATDAGIVTPELADKARKWAEQLIAFIKMHPNHYLKLAAAIRRAFSD